jgi:Protein of unknown function (DUF2815)
MSETKERRSVLKKVKGGMLFSDGTIRLDDVRASYPWVAKAQKNTADDGTETFSYSCGAYMPKTTHREIKDVCRDRIAEILREHKIKALGAERKFIRDGDESGKVEAEGMWMISSREAKRPGLRGPLLDPKTGKPERLDPAHCQDLFYGGCYINLLIRPWFQDNKFGKRVNAGLVAVQFLRDGPAFGEGRISDDEIDDTFEGEARDDGGWDDDDDSL